MDQYLLLKECLKRKPEAQRRLYDHFASSMLGVCFRYTKSLSDAEEVLQEGFIKVFTQIQQFRGQGALEGWIRRIIVHTCINILKKNKKFIDSVDLIHAGGMFLNENNIPSIVETKEVVESVRKLPIGYRTVLNLYAIEGFTHKEISQMLDIEESTSRSQYTRAKAMLEDILIQKKIIMKPKERIRILLGAK